MKKVILAALCSCMLAAPAAAYDNAPYIGFDLGVMKPMSTKVDFDNGLVKADDSIRIRHNSGWDADFVVGYDFGMFRLEVEAAYKRAGLKRTRIDAAPAAAVLSLPGTYDNDGRVKVGSGMLNALFDSGLSDTLGVAIGGGLGFAGVDYRNELSPGTALSFTASDRAFAWQGLAEVRMALGPAVDARLKYRYFETGRLDFGDFCQTSCAAIPDYSLDGKFRSHSLMLGLVYNFIARPAAPAPMPLPPAPPPPVATQVCPDGSVIAAAAACPPPPPPPPPPPAPVERGERGE